MNKNKSAVTGERTVARDYSDGDTITIEGKKYVIASLVGGGFTLLDASAPGWSPADFED